MIYLKSLLAFLATLVPHKCDKCKIHKCKRYYSSLHLTTYPDKNMMVCDACLERMFMNYAWEMEVSINYGCFTLDAHRKPGDAMSAIMDTDDYRALMDAYKLRLQALHSKVSVPLLVEFLKQASLVFTELDRISGIGGVYLGFRPRTDK